MAKNDKGKTSDIEKVKIEKPAAATAKKPAAATKTAAKPAAKKPAEAKIIPAVPEKKAAAKPAPKVNPDKKTAAKPAVKAEKAAAVKPATKTATKPASKPAAKKSAEVSARGESAVAKKPAASVKTVAPKEVKAVQSKEVKATTPKEVKAASPKEVLVLKEQEIQKKKSSVKKVEEDDSKLKILFVCSEARPFAGTGGLGEVIGSLPKAIAETSGDCEARVILPLYESFPDEYRKDLEFLGHINVPLAWRNQYCGLFRTTYNGVVYYLIDNEYYFKRPNLYGYYDDGERFSFLSRAVVELLPLMGWKPDILHCHDWQTALVPVYYKLFYMYREGYGGIKTVFTIHNIEYQGKYGKNTLTDVFGIPASEYASMEHRGCINLMKAAIDYSDAISTVSPSYAAEILDPYYAHGLENVLLKNSYKLRGILNGVDTESYDPRTNPALFKNYSAETIADKTVNKVELQKMLSLPEDPNIPMVAIISRLVGHKGLDLVRYAMDGIMRTGVQLVVLGTGDPDYENYFTHIQNVYDNKVCSIITFNRDLSHKIYAAADMFLMPSKSEPCGLSQMMACRYGTIPIVRLTGGLKDSIVDCGEGGSGNGFTFASYNGNDMLAAIERAVGLYRDYRPKWDGLVQRAIATDFSWATSAKEYVKFYNDL